MSELKEFTVIFAHTLPFGGVVALHYSFESAESEEKAYDRCKAGLGGHGLHIATLEGWVEPLAVGPNVMCWDNTVEYKTRQLKTFKVYPPKPPPKEPKKPKSKR